MLLYTDSFPSLSLLALLAGQERLTVSQGWINLVLMWWTGSVKRTPFYWICKILLLGEIFWLCSLITAMFVFRSHLSVGGMKANISGGSGHPQKNDILYFLLIFYKIWVSMSIGKLYIYVNDRFDFSVTNDSFAGGVSTVNTVNNPNPPPSLV